MRVAVYGTLRRGERNHRVLWSLAPAASPAFLGTTRLSERWGLWNLGSFPAVVARSGGGGARVLVEVFDVPRGVLRALDLLEGHPGFYRRQRVEVSFGEGKLFPVEVYVLPVERLPADARPIPSGDWLKRGT